MAPAEAPRRPPEPTDRRSPSPHKGHRGRHRGRDYDSPGSDDRAAYRQSYRTPERYDEPRSDRRASSGPAPATRGSDRAVAQHDDRPRRGTPNAATERGTHGRRDDANRRQRRSPSPVTTQRLRYDAPDTRRWLDWEPRTAPHTRPHHMTQDEPPRKRHRGRKRGRQTETKPFAGTPHRPPAQAPTGTQTTLSLVARRPQATQSPRGGHPRTHKKGELGRPRPPRVSEVQEMPLSEEQSRPRSSPATGMRPLSCICGASRHGGPTATWRTVLCGWMER